jgi:hypothetical protein
MKQMIPAIAAAAFFIATPALAGAQAPPSPSPSPSPTAAPAPTQAPAPMAERRSAKAETAKGELVKVDADAKSITIKGSDGVETVFAYNDATEVAGGRDGVAGLATKAGSKVTVHFTSAAGAKTATKIEVQGGADAPK